MGILRLPRIISAGVVRPENILPLRGVVPRQSYAEDVLSFGSVLSPARTAPPGDRH